MARLFLLLLLISAVSCQAPKATLGRLYDSDDIPLGSRIEFWIYVDADGKKDREDGWQKSNIHIASLPRPMTGARARRWAEGVGERDAGMRWTHYYILVTHPGPDGRQYRSATFAHLPAAYTPAARLQSPR